MNELEYVTILDFPEILVLLGDSLPKLPLLVTSHDATIVRPNK